MVKSPTSSFSAEAMALKETDLIIREFPPTIIIGSSWSVRFQLVDAEFRGLYNKLVKLVVKRPDGATYRNEGRTNASGMVTISVSGAWITQEGDYSFDGEFPGDSIYAGCEEEDTEIGVLVVC